jgi:bifunctional non-homologous end joining protein LigD
VAFDLLRREGEDLRLRPIEARREALKRLVVGASGAGGVPFSEALAAEGAVVFAKACELGLEIQPKINAARRDSRHGYLPVRLLSPTPWRSEPSESRSCG